MLHYRCSFIKREIHMRIRLKYIWELGWPSTFFMNYCWINLIQSIGKSFKVSDLTPKSVAKGATIQKKKKVKTFARVHKLLCFEVSKLCLHFFMISEVEISEVYGNSLKIAGYFEKTCECRLMKLFRSRSSAKPWTMSSMLCLSTKSLVISNGEGTMISSTQGKLEMISARWCSGMMGLRL